MCPGLKSREVGSGPAGQPREGGGGALSVRID